MAFARHQFEISEPLDDGQPLIAHLEAAWRQTGVQPDVLANAPELPAGCQALWADFLDLHASRGSNGFGACRITWRDIADWQAVNQVRLEPWELAAIRKADNMWLAEFAPKGGE